MRRFGQYIIASLALLLAACSPPADHVSNSDLKSEIDQVLQAHVKAINSGHFDAASDLYSPSTAFTWFEDGRLQYEARQDIEAAFAQISNATSDLKIDITDVDILSESHAYIAYNFDQSISFENGPNFSFSGVITAVMEKKDGQWQIAHGHTSTPKPRD